MLGGSTNSKSGFKVCITSSMQVTDIFIIYTIYSDSLQRPFQKKGTC